MNTSNPNNETTMNVSLPSSKELYAQQSTSLLDDPKFRISIAHFVKIMQAFPVKPYQQERLGALCIEYNALTREQQVAQNEPHLSAEDDFAVFTDKDGYCIIQHDPTYTTFKVMGVDAVEMTTRTML